MHNSDKKIIFTNSSSVNDFLNRFLDFAKRYDNFTHSNIYQTSTVWVNEKNYDYILYFLKADSFESIIPITLKEFVSMSKMEIEAWHDYLIELQHLYDEKHSLYKELLSYYK